jgi:N-acetylmuramoyl-L-alanine amidase CwlA
MNINKKLTPYNHNSGSINRIKYIVIHYVGALGGAEANCNYYAGGDRGASAHYYVGFAGEVWQSVEDKDVAWHCGAKAYKHPECRNSNTVGIEMCVRKRDTSHLGAEDNDWYFEDATVDSTVKLTKTLMAKYQITADRVIRHHDVTGKCCPNPYVLNTGKHTWDSFKAAISAGGSKAPSKPANNIQGVKPLSGTVQVIYKGSDGLNLRTTPSTSGAVKQVVHDGNYEVTGVSDDGKWYRLKTGLYVSSSEKYVKYAATKAPSKPNNSKSFSVRVTTDNLNIRHSAATKAAKKGYCPKGTYTIVETKTADGYTWGRLKSGSGWIALEYTTRA